MADLPHRLLHPHGKDRLSVLGETPLVAETPEDLLDDETTPVPASSSAITASCRSKPRSRILELRHRWGGRAGARSRVADLKEPFAIKTLRMVLECGGNGRSFFEPPAEGNPWTNGGVGCAEWTGVPLADVLPPRT